MHRRLLFVGLAVVLLASFGCSLGSIGKSSGNATSAEDREIAALEAHILELQRRAAIAEVEISRLEKRLAALERSSNRPGESATGKRSGGIRARAVPQSEPADSSTSAGTQAPGLEVSDLPVDSATMEGAVAGEDAGNALDIAAAGGGEDAAGSGNEELTASAQELYDRGYTLYHQGHYVDSETAFQQFLQRHSATVLGDNAQFWIAEARHARGDTNGALAAYRETATRFPGGNKVPDAQLKTGDCLRELGDTEGARRSYRAVISEFPGAAAATAARKRLAESP